MRKIILSGGTIVLFFLSARLFAQTENANVNCTQTLKTARATYDQGRLHELPTLLNGCLIKNEDRGGFTETERIEAYRLLTLGYIYSEEPAEADKSMVNLLHTDPFFQLDEIDPIEFKDLYKKFRTDPVYRIGLRLGGNTNFINVISNHYIWEASEGKGEYQSKPGLQFTALFEKDFKERFVINPEAVYSIYSFIYRNSSPLSNDNGAFQETGLLEHTIAQSKAQVNLLMQYKLKKPKDVADKFIPYVALGPSISYLLNSSFTGNTNVDEDVTATEFSTKSHYKPLGISLMAVAGAKIRVGGFYITGDVRFQYGFLNIVNKHNRLRWEAEDEKLLDFGYVDNDYSLSQGMLNLGIIFPRFNPKKIIR